MQTVSSSAIECEQPVSINVKKVDSSASIQWIEKGIKDFKVAPGVSFTYGLIYVVVGLLMAFFTWANPLFFSTMVAGFLLVGPVVAVGLFCMSRQIEQGVKPSLLQLFKGASFNAVSLASFALILVVLLGIWTLLASFVIVLFFDQAIVSDSIISSLIANKDAGYFMLTYGLLGFVIASFAFMISVVSIPMLTNQRVDVVTAMMTSVKAVKKNPLTLLGWAMSIAALFWVGVLFFFVGLAVTLPIIGHASWHAYRDLIE